LTYFAGAYALVATQLLLLLLLLLLNIPSPAEELAGTPKTFLATSANKSQPHGVQIN